MAKLICTLRSTFPQYQPDEFKCSACGCDGVRPHMKYCYDCGEVLTEVFYPATTYKEDKVTCSTCKHSEKVNGCEYSDICKNHSDWEAKDGE